MTGPAQVPAPAGRMLVVGGTGGIGAGIAAAYPDAIVWGRRAGVDATDPEQVVRASAEFLGRHGPPLALVHAVGDFDERPALASDLPFYRWMLDSNLTSAFLILRALLPAMAAARRGRVILFAAAGVEDQTAKVRAPLYFAAKAALVSLARSLAKEVAASGVTVNVISPGVIRHPASHRASQDRIGPKVPLGREGSVADVVALVGWLLSDGASYVTGANLTVDGGLAL
jgi:NAD(P)-dependent dehydrogenase (short-subunit alcohol dehydrogenase family)